MGYKKSNNNIIVLNNVNITEIKLYVMKIFVNILVFIMTIRI